MYYHPSEGLPLNSHEDEARTLALDKVLVPFLAEFSDAKQGMCKNTVQKRSRAWSDWNRDRAGFSHPPSFLQMNLPNCVFPPRAEPADEGWGKASGKNEPG